jgi:membrane protein implicated in regulation of membrane protease activity
MGWSTAVWWWIAAGGLVAVELASGTFYLLMLAAGALAGALAAHAGSGFAVQLAAAAVVGGAAVAALQRKRGRGPATEPAASNRDVILDIGSRVRVEHWRSDATARVQYRGAGWNARYAGSGQPPPGEYRISAIEGTELLLAD